MVGGTVRTWAPRAHDVVMVCVVQAGLHAAPRVQRQLEQGTLSISG